MLAYEYCTDFTLFFVLLTGGSCKSIANELSSNIIISTLPSQSTISVGKQLETV